MISVIHLSGSDLLDEARTALAALAARPGFVAGRVGRSTDSATDWVLVTEWDNVGSYRRALGNYDVKLNATPLLARAADGPTSFEELLIVTDSAVVEKTSDRAGG